MDPLELIDKLPDKEGLHITTKDIILIIIIAVSFGVHWAAFSGRLAAVESMIAGPPTLTSRVDKLEQSMDDIKDTLHEIRDAVRHK
jgi:hypothetical protein